MQRADPFGDRMAVKRQHGAAACVRCRQGDLGEGPRGGGSISDDGGGGFVGPSFDEVGDRCPGRDQ